MRAHIIPHRLGMQWTTQNTLRILGNALLDRQLVRCRLTKHLYKLILGWPIVLHHLKDFDVQYQSYLRSLERMFMLPNNNSHHSAQGASLTAQWLGTGGGEER